LQLEAVVEAQQLELWAAATMPEAVAELRWLGFGPPLVEAAVGLQQEPWRGGQVLLEAAVEEQQLGPWGAATMPEAVELEIVVVEMPMLEGIEIAVVQQQESGGVGVSRLEPFGSGTQVLQVAVPVKLGPSVRQRRASVGLLKGLH
jgi:hypothetical protein